VSILYHFAMGAVRWVDAGRGIAILMVVAGHTIDWTRADEVDPAAKVVLSIIVSCSLPLFFFISGVLSDRVPRMSWVELATRRVVPLVWVFLLWQPVVFGYKLAAEYALPEQGPQDIGAAFARLALSPIRPTGELWFIWALAIFYILARLLRRIPIGVQVAFAAVISIIWLSGGATAAGPAALTTIGVGWNGVLSYWVFFAIGVLLHAAKERVPGIPAWGAGLVVVVWLTVVTVLSILQLTAAAPLAFGVKTLGLIGGIAVARVLADSRLLRYVGRSTMPIYLVHTAVIVSVVSVAPATEIAPAPWVGTGACLLWIIAVGAGLLLGRIVEVTGATWLTRTTPARVARLARLPEQHVAFGLGREAERAGR
jgi:surface polysaccharide O-acyltransferase-like enzyme